MQSTELQEENSVLVIEENYLSKILPQLRDPAPLP